MSPSHLLFFLLSSQVFSEVLHDESQDGDLSNIVEAPSQFTIAEGSSIFRGSVAGSNETSTEFDLFTVTVPEGLEVVNVNLLDYSSSRFGNVSHLIVHPAATLPDSVEAISDRNNNFAISNIALSPFVVSPFPDERFTLLSLMLNGGSHGQQRTLVAGQHAFWVNENGNNNDPVVTDYEIELIADKTAEAYIADFLTPAQQTDPALSNVDGDANQDGISNLIDFAFRNNPVDPDRALYPSLSTEDGEFCFSYRRRIGGGQRTLTRYQLGELEYTVQTSSTLDEDLWSRNASLVEQVGDIVDNGDGTETVKLRAAGSLVDEEFVFFRLRIEK